MKWMIAGGIALFVSANVFVMQMIFSNSALIIEVCLAACGARLLYRGKHAAHLTISAIFLMGWVLLELSIQAFIWNLLIASPVPENVLITGNTARGIYLLLMAAGFVWIDKKGKEISGAVIGLIRKYQKYLYILIPILFFMITYYQRIYYFQGTAQMSMGNWLLLIFVIYVLVLVIMVYMWRENQQIEALKYQMTLENYKKSQEQYQLKAEMLHDEKITC